MDANPTVDVVLFFTGPDSAFRSNDRDGSLDGLRTALAQYGVASQTGRDLTTAVHFLLQALPKDVQISHLHLIDHGSPARQTLGTQVLDVMNTRDSEFGYNAETLALLRLDPYLTRTRGSP